MLFAGVLDVIYARYSRKRPVTGYYLFVIGLVMIVGQAALLALVDVPIVFSQKAAAWGIFAGAIVMVANAMLVESLGRINVSLGSTIYRLNTIGVVIFAVVFLHEALTAPKLGGIALGIVAVVLLYQHGGRSGHERLLLASVSLAIGASLLRATFGIMSKVGLTDGTDAFLFMLYIAIGWTLAAMAYGVIRRQPKGALRNVIPYAVGSGALICLVVSFLLLGLRTGEASVVIPIANMSFVVALLTSAAFRMERFTGRKLVAVATAAVAIALLTTA